MEIEHAIELLEKGAFLKDVARMNGVCAVTMRKRLVATGYSPVRRRGDLRDFNLRRTYVGEGNPAFGHRRLGGLSRGTLKRLYGMYGTYKCVAVALGVSANTVKKAMCEGNMCFKGGRRCKFSAELLRRLYFEKGMTVRQMGKVLGVDDGALALTMRSYGILYWSNKRMWTRQMHCWEDGQRERIRARDGVCFVCGCVDNGKELAVHHILYDVKYDEDRHLVSLCASCHSKTNGNRSKWISYFIERLAQAYGYSYVECMNEGGEFCPSLRRVISYGYA